MKNTVKVDDFKKKLDKDQLIQKLVAKNLKGGAGDPPPFCLDPT